MFHVNLSAYCTINLLKVIKCVTEDGVCYFGSHESFALQRIKRPFVAL